LHLTRLSEGREIIGDRTRSQWKPTDLNLRVVKRIVRNQIKNMEKATGAKIEVLKRILPEFFQDQTKQNPRSAISSGATIIQNKQDAIKKISKALLEHMNGKPCTWSDYNRTEETILRQEKVYSRNGRRITQGLHFYNLPYR